MTEEKTQFAFRTEMSADNNRVPSLMEAMGLILESETEISEPSVPEYKMGVFTFYASLELEQLRTNMEQLVENDDRFVDMHRCYQTLSEGTEPDDFWYAN